MFEKKYDLVVCGGGVAGIAAALAAARRNLKTCLIEKSIQPGGLATGGLVLIYLPLCNGMGKQVTFGISEELLRASIKYGPDDIPENWNTEGVHPKNERFRTYFSPAGFILAMDELIAAAGIDVWYDTVITGVERSGRNIDAVNVFNKSGHGRITGGTFIDATGDSDVAFMAELPCIEATNALVTWAIEHREAEASSCYSFGTNTYVKIKQQPLDTQYTAPGIDGRMVSDFVQASRKFYLEDMLADHTSGKETRYTSYPLYLPGIPPLRHTRCIKGRSILQPGQENRSCADSIGLAADWRCAGKVWEIPWSTMLPEDVDNLIAAGRCTSASDDAWEITRVIPAAAMTGEVAGVAAALAHCKQSSAGTLTYHAIVAELQRNNHFPVKLSEVGLSYRS